MIAGPTGVGKTALGIRLAKHYRTEIISADSRQFYKQLEIGTAKPDKYQLNAVKHHFIGHRDISDLYGAGHFARDAETLLEALFKVYDVVIVVGGSGLYLDALLKGVDEFEDVPLEVRNMLNETYAREGIEPLREELKEKDPAYFAKVDQNNPQRIIRALEIIRHTGKPFSFFLNLKKEERDFIPVKILINTERERLYRQIEERVDKMMEAGLLEEVKGVLLYKDQNALKTVGYKELFQFLDGEMTLEEAVTKIKQHTRNYAKRQLTWFRNRDNYTEFGPEDDQKIIEFIEQQRNNV